jgi:hypothetical protein
MSIKKQEEEVKLWTEACKSLFNLLLTLTAGLLFIGRTLFDKTAPSLKAFNRMLLLCGLVFEVVLVGVILWMWFKIKSIIKTL